MASHVVGYPRIGPKRELKFAQEAFWDKKISASELEAAAHEIRLAAWKQMADAGVTYIPSNTFSFYDQMLDNTVMLGAVPERYEWTGGAIGLDVYFAMARGNVEKPAMEMTKWFDTNYHYIVPELHPDQEFKLSSRKALLEYREALASGIETVPVLIGPFTFLQLSKPAKGAPPGFDPLELLPKLVPVYREVLRELSQAGARWIQLDEPALVFDLSPRELAAFQEAYASLGLGESTVSAHVPSGGTDDQQIAHGQDLQATVADSRSVTEPRQISAKILLQTYFADVPLETYRVVSQLSGVAALGLDLVRGSGTLAHVQALGLPGGKLLFAGVVDGRNVWANDMAASLALLEDLGKLLGSRDRLVVSTSCSLLHTAVDLRTEAAQGPAAANVASATASVSPTATTLDEELRSWMAFAAQKVEEVVVLGKATAMDGRRFEDVAVGDALRRNAEAMELRRRSPRVHNPSVQQAVAALKASDQHRTTPVAQRLAAQQRKLQLPLLPTTTIGSFPQTPEIRRTRREFKNGKISETEYVAAIRAEIGRVVQTQVDLDLDVLVHGEPERNDMVEYFGEQLSGFAFTAYGWVQSYGSRCVKPPIIFGDVRRPRPMTVEWSSYAKSQAAGTGKPMKGMLTGPVTILNWSFVRNDQPRSETCMQIALAIQAEVLDLEAAGIEVIQIDEAAVREGLPLRRAEQAHYLDWAVRAFRVTCAAVRDDTQIHTHMCYSNFNDILDSIIAMDADVITIENSRSDEKLLSAFHSGGVRYPAGIGPGVYDIHSPRVPSAEEMAERIRTILTVVDKNMVWVNPDCGLKTRKYEQVLAALAHMVEAVKKVRAELQVANPEA